MGVARDDGDDLLARMQAMDFGPACDLLGFRLLGFDRETAVARCSFEAKPEFCNPRGAIQGGIVAAMLDTAMSIAGVGKSNLELAVPTLEMKTTYLRPALPGTLYCEGRVVRMGRNIAFFEGTLSDADGKQLATATSTAFLIPDPNKA